MQRRWGNERNIIKVERFFEFKYTEGDGQVGGSSAQTHALLKKPYLTL